MEYSNRYILEELGYNKEEILEILGFKACFQIKSRRVIGEESAARLYNKFNGCWRAAGLWYQIVERHHEKIGRPLLERDVVNEVVDELEYYQSLIKDNYWRSL